MKGPAMAIVCCLIPLFDCLSKCCKEWLHDDLVAYKSISSLFFSYFFAICQHLSEFFFPVLIHKYKPRVLIIDCNAIPDFESTELKMQTDFDANLREEGLALWLVELNLALLKPNNKNCILCNC